MIRSLRSILALAAITCLALTGVASAAKSITVTPKKPGPKSIVTVTVKNAKVKQVYKAKGRLYAELTPPPVVQNEDEDVPTCNTHHEPKGTFLAKGTKAKFRMDPGDALAGPGRWCKGTWKVRLYALVSDGNQTDPTDNDVTIARTSFVKK
jgi:hypothetical protein